MMRAGQVSIAALATAAALAFGTPAAIATTPSDAVPAPVGINWPPQAPSFSPTATAAEPKPEAEKPAEAAKAPPAVDVVPPSNLALPQSAPAIEAPKAVAFSLGDELVAKSKALKPADAKSRADRDAAAKAYESRQGQPAWVDEAGFTPGAVALMTEIKAADSYGLQASAFKLPTETWTPGAKPTPAQLIDAEIGLSLAALQYARHARGDRIDPSSLSKLIDRKAQVYEPGSVLGELVAAKKPDAYLRALHPSHSQFERLRLKYLAVKSGQSLTIANAPPPPVPDAKPKKGLVTPAPLSNAQMERKLFANMEMWRWMPDMAETHIHNNIPEFTTRLVRENKTVHLERIVTGTANTPTPIFSDAMSIVVFKPFWNVPESIKWKELQPQLARYPGSLAKAGLKAAYNGREIDPATVDWTTTDLRAFHVFQPPGAGNALGVVKFLFPNKHDVYMHDTPQKPLFEQSSRAFSHGCMRLRDPLKFAELLLGHDKGMTRAQVNQLAASGPDNNEIRLTKKIPIHITYFTAWVDDDGGLKTFADVYSHEQKVHLGLEGKMHLIVQPQIERDRPPPRNATVAFRETRQKSGGGDPLGNWIKNVFNF